MVREIVLHAGEAPEVLARIRDALEDPEAILKQIGALVVAQAQRAFREEAFDGKRWPHRYPNQDDPVVNLAGVVADLNRGLDEPRTHRFDRRPVGKDSGDLWQSISDKETAITLDGTYVVEVGSTLPQASKFQFGGLHSQPVPESTKEKIGRFIETPRGSPYWWKLKFVTGEELTELETDIVPRPYLGITYGLEKRIIKTTEGTLAALKPEEG